VVVASIFAAIISTADSQLLVAASAVVRDFYEKIVKRGEEIPQKRLVLYSRIVVGVLVAVAFLFGTVAPEDLVFWFVLFSWSGLGASLGPTSILALYWKRVTRAGVIAGLITGMTVTLVWQYTPALEQLMYELVPAFFAALIMTVVVSLRTKPPENVEALFESMKGR